MTTDPYVIAFAVIFYTWLAYNVLRANGCVERLFDRIYDRRRQ